MKKSDWAPPKKKEEWHRCEECGMETFGWLSVFGDVLPPISQPDPKPDSMASSRCLSHNKLPAPREPLCQLPEETVTPLGRCPIQEDDPHEFELWHMAKYDAWESQDEARRESGEFGRNHYRGVEGKGMPDA